MQEQKIEFRSIDGVRLAGTFCQSDSRKGLAIFTHGIPSNRAENGFYTSLAEKLSAIGFDSFRFDFREMGESEKRDVTRLSVNDLICDTESAYLAAREISRKEYKRICAVGFSCGGGILLKWCNIYAHKEVKDLFLLCPVLDYVYECTGYGREDFATHREQVEAEIRKDGYVKDRDEKYGAAFLASALDLDYDRETELSKANITVFHGDRDKSVPIEISRSYAAKHVRQVELVEIGGAGHGFFCVNNDGTGSLSEALRAEKSAKMRNEVIDRICVKLQEGYKNERG